MSGSSTVLGCRYHGWTYNSRGKLLRAPEFDGLPGFDKKLNGLFEIRTKATSEGCVFVNFDAGEVVPAFEKGNLSLMECWGIRNCHWVRGWSLEGSFNWKLAGMSYFLLALEERLLFKLESPSSKGVLTGVKKISKTRQN